MEGILIDTDVVIEYLRTKEWKDLDKKHQHVEIRDIFIASIAIRNNAWLCTFNKKHFKGIKDIRVWNGSQ